MKFEDLKLPSMSWHLLELARKTARAVYDQMRAHYEAKLAEAKPEPEELFEHPDMPGKKFRRLKVGETIEETDMFSNKGVGPMKMTERSGFTVLECLAQDYYREVPQPATEWRLPDPPPGQQWHRDDWTQDMLPEGYRPLLLEEAPDNGDEVLSCGRWREQTPLELKAKAREEAMHQRTRRPLPATPAQPAPVEYVPLGPGDIQPGSVVRCIGATWWKQVTGVRAENITVCAAGNLSWQALADSWEILRPGSTTWEPCKKPKP